MTQRLTFLLLILSLYAALNPLYAQSGYVFTVAGGGSSTADGIPATAASLSTTGGIGVDAAGNIYFSDIGYSKVKKVDPHTGLIYTVAGDGLGGFSGDGGPATAAGFGDVRSICVDGPGNIYIADHANNRVRRVDATTGIITTFAGGGSSTADGIPATAANIGEQLCVVLDSAGYLYCSGINSVRKINPATGIITTVAGGGTSSANGIPATAAAISSGVKSISLDGAGNIYIISHDGTPLREVSAVTGLINTIAGAGTSNADNIPATAFQMFDNHCARADAAGNIFFADWGNNTVRRLDAVTGIVSIIAGTGSSTAEGVSATTAQVNSYQIYLDPVSGNVFWADFSLVIRKFAYSPIYGTGSLISGDSFSVNTLALCNGPQLTFITPYYVPGESVKMYFGDGTTDSTVLTHGFISGAYAIVNHKYPVAGTYSIRSILYNGATAVDSLNLTYVYTFCRSFPIDFYNDENGDCMLDGSEHLMALPSTTEVDSNGVPIDTICATNGFIYSAYGHPDDVYTFKVLNVPGNLSVTCPSTGIIKDTVQSLVSDNPVKYVAMQCSTSTRFDLALYAIVPVTGVHDEWGNIYVTNSYCEPQDATVSLIFSPKYVSDDHGYYDISPLPATAVGNTLTWNVSGIASNSARPVDLYYAIWDNPTLGYLTAGDSVHSNYRVTPTIDDVDTSNNVEIIIDTVRSGCDPNEMSVTPAGCLPYTTGATQLQYTLNFTNTGNDTAFNISVLDTLPAGVDPSSFRLVLASHEMYVTNLNGPAGQRILKFDFPNIDLLDSSHHSLCSGAVIFTVNSLSGLPDGTTLSNRAGVYFDINPVVMTNSATNAVGCATTLSTSGIIAPEMQIIPNPTYGEVTIKTSGVYSSVTVSNTLGKVIHQQPMNGSQATVDMQSLPAGLYFITLVGDGGTVVRKVVKM